MREIVLDTETTGFDPFSGDRIVEIGALELFNHMPTGKTFHEYMNPERFMPDEAFKVHGIGPDLLQPPKQPEPGAITLRDKPLFAAFGQKFLDFIGSDSKLVIHNAKFDMKFLNAELKWMNLPEIPMSRALDTLEIARNKFPGSPATLDALCRRFGIDNGARSLHGALLDSEILAEVYLELIGGRQPDLVLATKPGRKSLVSRQDDWRPSVRSTPLPARLTAEEEEAHRAYVESMGENALWTKLS